MLNQQMPIQLLLLSNILLQVALSNFACKRKFCLNTKQSKTTDHENPMNN